MIGVQSLGPLVPRRVSDTTTAAERPGPDAGAGLPRTVGRDTAYCGGGVAESAAAAESAGVADVSVLRIQDADRPVLRAVADLERDAWVVLTSVQGLGPVSLVALLTVFGSARATLLVAAGPNGSDRLLEAFAEASSVAAAADVRDPCGGAVFEGSACAAALDRPAGRGSSVTSPRSEVALPETTPPRARIGPELALRICRAVDDGPRLLARNAALGLTAVTLQEADYPDRLRRVELPPPLLYVRGSVAALSGVKSVAVVGTRWPTDRGRSIAGGIGSAIARAGGVVVSGLAVGTDGAAHAAVVGEDRPTVAVLGGGHARLFPRVHDRLAAAIVDAGGAVVSEHAPDVSPSRGTFPRRNRLISGMSDATVVVEAGLRSGALITAGWALEQGRECFLVPGPLDSPASAGCHAFLRSFPGQARLVAGIAELLEDLELSSVSAGPGEGSAAARRSRSASAPPSSIPGAGRDAVLGLLGSAERALAERLTLGPATADQLAAATSLTSAAVLSALTLLELRGLVTGVYGRYAATGPLASRVG
jgi:DNA processing protein